LSVSYSASIGGAGSLVGTPPNLILKGYFDNHHPDAGLNFLSYMLFSLPIAIITILIAWIVMALIWLPKKFDLFTISKIYSFFLFCRILYH
jgi:solute carrier family 13 (sodium-dependent dicarboxylate transporter), member 2/3/5